MNGPGTARAARWFERALVAATMAAAVWFFHWTTAANAGFGDWDEVDYFKLLVRGWKKGQLSLDIAPKPELLALADPYDPAQNAPHRLGDATLYKGKYYIYFGPAPALTVMLPWNLVTGREMSMGTAVFVFSCLGYFAACGLWLALRRRYFPESHLLVAPLGVLALGSGTHLLALVQRPMFWELPIAAGIAFALLAAAAIYAAVHGRRPLAMMALAGVLLGLGVGSRPTVLFAAGMLLLPVWLAWRERDPARPAWWRLGLAGTVPLGLCGLAIMAHNYARFDNPLEWGQNYQLSGAYEGKLVHFALRFLPHNVGVYFFQHLQWSADFPFARAVGIEINHIKDYFGTEEVAGLAVTFPYFWFLLALPLAWWRRGPDETRRLTAALGGVLAYAVPVGGLVMGYFSTTTRYQTDFAVVTGLLALVGLLAVERWIRVVRPRLRIGVVAAAIAAVAVTAVIGGLMSFDYHGRTLRTTSPALWQMLDGRTEAMLAFVGQKFDLVDGPQVLKVRWRQQPAGTIEPVWEPLDRRADERILVEHIGEKLIRFGYARGGEEIRWGRPLKWANNHTHTVEIQVPSLHRAGRNDRWSRVRERTEFRRRTGVAVWFSGGRALDAIAPAWPADLQIGGRISREFSGEVRSQTTRAFRPDEVPSGLVEEFAKRGGVLRFRVVFPEPLQEAGEPLFAAGAHFRSNILAVETWGDGIRFAYENYSFPRVNSEPFKPNPAGHWVELEMASFRPDDFGGEGTGDVVVRLDGKEMIRSRQEAYHFPWGHERIGWNPFGTTCAAEFRGWITEARWIQARPATD